MSTFIPVFDEEPVNRDRAALPEGSVGLIEQIAALVAPDGQLATHPAADRHQLRQRIAHFEQFLAHVAGLKKVTLTGTDAGTALRAALRGVGIGARDRVAIFGAAPAATASAVLGRNAIPVPIDAAPESWTMSADALGNALEAAYAAGTRITAAVLAPRYDRLGEFDALTARCRAYGVRTVGDLTHAMWAKSGRYPLAELCDVAVLALPGSGPWDKGEVAALAGRDDVVARALAGPGWERGPADRRGLTFGAELLAAGFRIEQLARVRDARAAGFAALDRTANRVQGLAPTPADERGAAGPLHGKLLMVDPAGHGFRPTGDPQERAELMIAIRLAYGHLLAHEVTAPAAPLNDPWAAFDPLGDRANAIDEGYLAAIDPRRWELPNLDALHCDALVIEPDFALLPDAARLLQQARDRVARDARRLQERVPAILERFGAWPV